MDTLKKAYDNFLLSGRQLQEEEFSRKIDEFLADKTDEEKELIRNYMIDRTREQVETIKAANEEISMLKQLDGIENYINLASLSRNYFGKTKTWLYQRLHGYSVHNKTAAFTQEEKVKLSEALLSLSNDIRNVALKIV